MLLQFRPEVNEAARERVLKAQGLQVLRVLRAEGILKLRIPEGTDPQVLAARLRVLAEVAAAEPNYFRYVDAVPNDPRFGEMYALHNTGQTGGVPDADIDAPEAWNIAVGSPNVVVAVLDSGIDMTHPDLQANLYTNPGETLNGVDDDGNGFVDDIHGWDFRDNDNDPSDPSTLCSSHGTHTSGTVGAVGNNGIGVSGVAQTVRIMPLRAFYVSLIFCTAQDADLIDAMDYMKRMNVPISNNSWGGGPFSQLIQDAVAGTRGLFVTSAGNSGSNNDASPSYPASYDLENIIAVAATTDTDALASFSNFGLQSVDIAAPGEQILSTTRGGTYGLLSGTSMSSPHVAGAAAVLLGNDSTLTAHEIRAKLLRSTDFKGLPVATGGRLNLFNALNLPPSAVAVDLTPLGSTVVSPGTKVNYSVQLHNPSGSTRVVTASVRAWTPEGTEISLQGPLSVTLAAGQTISKNFSASVPASASAGAYRVIGRVENATDTFDEDQVVYQVN
jgi:subtilisin family serine protease